MTNLQFYLLLGVITFSTIVIIHYITELDKANTKFLHKLLDHMSKLKRENENNRDKK